MAVSATDIQICEYKSGAVHQAWFKRTANKTVFAGYGYDSANWVTVIKFTLEKPSKSVSFKLWRGNTVGGQRKLNYKIFSSENSAYNNANYKAESDGTVTIASTNYTAVTLKVEKTLPSGTHYLYLWTSMSTSNQCYSELCNDANGRFTVTYEELDATVRIDSGTAIGAYMARIEDGTAFGTYMAYIEDGKNWYPYS